MDTEAQQGSGSQPKRLATQYAIIAVVAAAAFGVVTLVHAPVISYAVVAILAGMCYALVTVMNRGRG